MREKLKSLVLLLLVALLFFNLFLYTGHLQTGELKVGSVEIQTENLAAVLNPSSVSYKDEKGIHFKSALGKAEMAAASRIIAKSLNELMIGPRSLRNEVSGKIYEENSLSFYMNLKLDIKALISLVVDDSEHKALQNLKLKGKLEEIILPLELKNLVFKIDGICYEVPLLSELRADAELIKSAIIRSASVKYAYSNILGGKNSVLLPVGGYLAPPRYILDYKREFGEPELDAISRKLFGAGSDFLKSAVTGEGSIILVYGYGDEILNVDREGFILYKNNLNPGAKPATIRTALSSVLSFIIRLNGEDHGYRLAALSYNSEEDVYLFHFSALNLELPLIIDSEHYDISAEVKSGQVISYRQYYYDLEVEEGSYLNRGIDFSSKYVSGLMRSPGLSPEISKLGDLKELSLSYLKTAEGISPVIVISGEKAEVIVDYYTGEIK